MKTGIRHAARRLRHPIGSIFVKNLLMISLVVLLPMALVLWISNYSFSAFTRNEISSYSYRSIRTYQTMTNSMLNDYLVQGNYLSNDSDVTMFLLPVKEDVLFYNRNYIYAVINNQMNVRDYLDSVYIYSSKKDTVLSNYGETRLKNFFDHSWLPEYRANTTPSRFWCAFRVKEITPSKSVSCLSLYKSLGTLKDNEGVIVFNIDFNKFIDELITMRGENDEGLFVVDKNNRLVATAWGDFDQTVRPGSLNGLTPGSPGESGDYVLYRAPIRYTEWDYVLAVPASMYSRNIQSQRQLILVVISCAFLVVVVLAVLISFRIYRPFRNILGVLEAPVSPSFLAEMELKSDEESYILASIRRTLRKNEAISRELNERIALLKKAQSVALQSQINPHFLYNTLDTINWSAMRLTGGKNDTSIMIAQLASMLRYSLENANTLVPLAKELDNVSTYLALQSNRYKNKITVEWDVEEEVKSCQVIKLMLQPLVENAIYHGIKPLRGPGVIRIEARRQDGDLLITVADNGLGMSRHAVERLNASLDAMEIQEQDHFGVVNVNQRIRLFFGDDYGMTIHSEENQGSRAVLRLPFYQE